MLAVSGESFGRNERTVQTSQCTYIRRGSEEKLAWSPLFLLSPTHTCPASQYGRPTAFPGAGYGVVIGLGALFAIVVVGISRSLVRYAGIGKDAEEFSVARRSLGTGLTAAAVISSWTWSTTLLSSVSTAYNYGVAGAMLYASGNCTQIVLFSTLAIQLKRRAPSVHTYLELVRIRFGTLPHFTYIFFALATNILVCSSVLLGGAAAINSITGMNTYAALFLLPASVVAYTLRGGLRSTILADYLHTVITFIILFILWLRAYATFPRSAVPQRCTICLRGHSATSTSTATTRQYPHAQDRGWTVTLPGSRHWSIPEWYSWMLRSTRRVSRLCPRLRSRVPDWRSGLVLDSVLSCDYGRSRCSRTGDDLPRFPRLIPTASQGRRVGRPRPALRRPGAAW